MKMISKKMKSICLLAVMALLCACMLVVPMMPKAVSADVPEEAKNLVIKSAQIVVQKDKESDTKEWATMFKAEISAEGYNAITSNGDAFVKFGMLIGPAKRLANVTDYQTAIDQAFKAFAHVGTACTDAPNVIEFEEGASTYNYYAGIVYDDAKLAALNLKDVAALELVAIPYYETEIERVVVLENAKTATPSNVLVESYALEQNDGLDNISAESVGKYVGEVKFNAGEYYVCQSTDRLMGAAEVNGDLTAQDLALSASDSVYYGQELISEGALDASGLTASETQRAFAVVHADGKIDAYVAKVATRVIERFFYDEAGSTLENYFAGEKTADKPTNAGSYASIFYMNGAKGGTFDGLYVLAKNIVPTKTGSIYVSGKTYGGYDATEGYGIRGTIDGRGKTIDFIDGSYKVTPAYGGFLAPLYGATIKNIAFEELINNGTGSGVGALASDTKLSTFENVYVNISDTTDFRTNWLGGLLFGKMNNAKNTFTNMIVNADVLDYDYYDNVLAKKSQYQSISSTDKGFGALTKGLWSCSAYVNLGGNSYDNFFAVGSNPAVMTSSWASYPATLGLTHMYWSVTTLPYYNDGGTIKLTEKYMTDPATGKPTYSMYTIDQFVGTVEANNGVDENGNDIPDHIEEIFKRAKYTYECRYGRLEVQARIDAGDQVKVHLDAQKGLYDMSNAEFNSFVKNANNAAQLAKFDSTYWTVDATNGAITWKTIPVVA